MTETGVVFVSLVSFITRKIFTLHFFLRRFSKSWFSWSKFWLKSSNYKISKQL